MKRLIALSLTILCTCAMSTVAQNRVVFDNQSGEHALVKLIGPTQTEVEVQNGAVAGSDAVAGRYFIKVRYGSPGKYYYVQGQKFEVKETAAVRSETTITLNKVAAVKYKTSSISADEFGKTRVQPRPSTTLDKQNAPSEAVKELMELLNDTHSKTDTNLDNYLGEVSLWGKIGQAAYRITEKNDQRDAVMRTMAFVRLKELEASGIFCKRGILALSYFPQLSGEFTPLLQDMEKSKDGEIAKFARKTLVDISKEKQDSGK